MIENHMVLPDYYDELCTCGESNFCDECGGCKECMCDCEEESPSPCIFCGNHCDETCEELGPEPMPAGYKQESHLSAALSFGLAWFLALTVVGILAVIS